MGKKIYKKGKWRGFSSEGWFPPPEASGRQKNQWKNPVGSMPDLYTHQSYDTVKKKL